jgi:hypothetical protein
MIGNKTTFLDPKCEELCHEYELPRHYSTAWIGSLPL